MLGRLLCSPYVCHLSWPRVLAAQEHYLHKQQFISATSLLWDQLQNLLQSIKTRVFYVFKTVSPAPNLSCTVSLFVQYYYRTLILETDTPRHGHQFIHSIITTTVAIVNCFLLRSTSDKCNVCPKLWTTGENIFTSEQVNLNLSMAASQGK